jgi:hypothetical protein
MEMTNTNKNEVFYPAKEMKNHFEVVANYIQWGQTKHTKKKSVLKGVKVLGIKTWEIENPNYCTEEVYNKKVCKCSTDRMPTITTAEWIFEN